ncbi:ESPR-type extended signal peptide-containing protein [uncultured Megasphaera sp.]|uniref:ESPR-type extended signal peptide-containing protein n=1 Tax=uncultured Megasphaera sp. TaxID=165188 RepID=UPI0026342D61|nr:ESPR-type extended signal peptide-containing protein [uncultured Megasphaera sp.]
MNRIYKVIWNKVRNAYVVVSEFAKGHARNTVRSGAARPAAMLRLAVLLACTTSTIAVGGPLWAQAAGTVDAGTASGTNALAVGSKSSASGTGSVAVGNSSTSSDYAIAIGDTASVGGSYTYAVNGSTGYGSDAAQAIAIGHSVTANGLQDVVIGSSNTAATPTSAYYETDKKGNNSAVGLGGRILIGHDNDATGRADNATVLGSNNVVNAPHGIAIGQNVQSGQASDSGIESNNTMVIGVNSKALSSNSIALGNGATAGNSDKNTGNANGQGAIAIGESANSTAYYTVALGHNAQATNAMSVAVGDGSQATGWTSSAVGNGAKATGYDSVSMGSGAKATKISSVSMGAGAEASGDYSIAIGGQAAHKDSEGKISYGSTQATGTQSVAIGRETTAAGSDSLAMGYLASVAKGATNAIALGETSTAYGVNSVAIGAGARVGTSDYKNNVSGGVALGAGSNVFRDFTTTDWNQLGKTWTSWVDMKNPNNSHTNAKWAATIGAVSIGSDGYESTDPFPAKYYTTRQLTGLAAGTYDTDAVNVAQWKNTMLATVGDAQGSKYNSSYGTDGVNRNLTRLYDEQLTLTGAADDGTTLTKDQMSTDANIGTLVDNNKITFRLAKKLTGLTSVTTGNTKMESDGLTITNTTDSSKNVVIQGNTISMGGNTITNVGSGGTTETNAANIGDVKKLATTVTKGTNTTVSSSTNSNGGTDYVVDLADKVTLGTGTSKQVILDGTSGNAVIGGVTVGQTADGVLKYRNVLSGNYDTDAPGGTYVYGLSNTKWDETKYVSGRAATEDQLYQVGQKANQDIQNISNQIGDGTFGLTAEDGSSVQTTLGNKLTVKGDGTNITTKIDDADSALQIELSNNLNLGNTGSVQMGNTTINNSGVTITHTDTDGNSNNVSLTENGLSNGGNKITHIAKGDISKTSTDAVNGSQLYDVQTLASQHTTVKAGSTNVSVTEGINDAGGKKYTIDLAKDVTFGSDTNQIAINGTDGTVTVGTGDNQVKLDGTDGSVTAGGVTINKSGKGTIDGLTNKTWDGKNYISGQAATEDQLHQVESNTNSAISNVDKHHTEVTVNGEAAPAAEGIYTEGNLQIAQKTGSDGQKIYDLKLSDNLNIGGAGKDGQAGTNGHMDIKGSDGNSGVSLDGKDGISIKGQDGKDGVTIKGTDGTDGTEGHIGLTGLKGVDGQDAVADIHVKSGQNGVDGTDGNNGTDGMDRVVYEDHNNVTHEVATLDDGLKFGGDFGDASAVKLNKQVNIKGNAKNEADLTDGNIGVVSSQDGDNGQLLVKLNKDLNLGDTGSVKMGNTTINNGGVTIQNVSLTGTGLNNGGNKITNIAAGDVSENSTDAVNGSQLHAVEQKINNVETTAGQHTTVKAGSTNVSVTEGSNAAGGKEYTVNLANDVTFGSDANQIAINGTDGTVTVGTGDKQVKLDGSDGSVTAGGVTINKAGSGTIDGLTNTTWTEGTFTSGQAATEDQLHTVESNVNKKIDNINTAIENVDKHHTEVTVNGEAAPADGTYTEGNLQIAQTKGADGQKIYDLKLSDNLNIGGAGKDGAPGKDGHMGINGADGKSGVGIDGKDGISIQGKDGQNGVTIKGVDGKDGTEGHIGLTGPKGADGQNATADIHVKNGQNGVDGTDGHGGKDGMDRVVYEDHNHITHEVATMDDGMKYSGDSGNAAVKLNKNVQIYGGATEYADGNNIGVVASQDGDNAKLQVKLAKDLKGINSIEAKTITTGDTTINNGGLMVKGDDNHKDITIQQGNVNMGGNKIEGVADGKVSKDSTDAVNGSQLWQRDQAINGLSGSVNKLGNRVNRVGAGAAALAALHPLDFDPDDKWDFAAGYGNYKDASAVAVGAYYRPNEDTMFSIGGSFGGGENMVNAGVSFKLGQGNHVSTSRVAMAKEIKDLRKEIEGLRSALADVAAGNRLDPTKTKLFPDIPQNHWAYNEIAQLYGNGIVQGYPDGNFGGDRMMTRYEFAMMVYRQMQRGAALSDRIVNEFEPELERIRIDTITKDKDGNPVIQRVRVIKDRG